MARIVLIVVLALVANCRCDDLKCGYNLVETIAEGLHFTSGPTLNSTFEALLSLIDGATSSLDLSSYYWSLRGTSVMEEPGPTSRPGEQVLEALAAAVQRGVTLRIVADGSGQNDPLESFDLKALTAVGAQVRPVNISGLVGAGVQWVKMIVADRQSFHVGSASMDWRSLTQTKELGLLVTRCPQLAEDLSQVFETFWYLGSVDQLPDVYPDNLSTSINQATPFRDGPLSSFFSTGPKPLCPPGRTNELEAIIQVMREAKQFIYISVTEYLPLIYHPNGPHFWPTIDMELRAAVVRKVKVRLLAAHGHRTLKSMVSFLKSLDSLSDYSSRQGNMEAKLFKIPSTPGQFKIPAARTNNNKFMVTDQHVYIGQSSWLGDYFESTSGLGLVVKDESQNGSQLRNQLIGAFERDWNSEYAHSVRDYVFSVYRATLSA
ncbi:5'-3' exonuclease PLD3 [Halotydeus destructor]|nr:5'-3' exonuclease PLD3 [Halotydeus destructor]